MSTTDETSAVPAESVTEVHPSEHYTTYAGRYVKVLVDVDPDGRPDAAGRAGEVGVIRDRLDTRFGVGFADGKEGWFASHELGLRGESFEIPPGLRPRTS